MICKKCNLEKDSLDFFPYFKTRCKDCVRAYWRMHEKSPARKKYRNKWDHLPEQVEKRKKHNEKYFKEWYKKNGRKRNKLQMQAHALVAKAIDKGLLVRPEKCSHCTNTNNIEAHHDDYKKPLDIMWLCGSCHRKYHIFKVPLSSI